MALPAVAELTDKQQVFVKALAEGTKQGEAAKLAGYSSPDQQASALVRLPAIQRAVREERERVINCDLSNLALKKLRQILEDAPVTAPTLMQAVRLTLELGGHGQKDSNNNSLRDKPLEQMTEHELLDAARRIRAELAKEADPAPDNAQIIEGEASEVGVEL